MSPGGLERDPDPVTCSLPGGRDRDHTAPRRRSSARDIQRYAALFAQRTKVMRSSAMRDLMALTEREDVISLAGGLPDTSTFPADSYAALMNTIAGESCARALQYGPTEGFARVKDCIARVMAAEGMEVDTDELLVTSGGQQVIDLVCKTLVDPGDVVVAEAPTYPGAIPTFSSYQADVVQVRMDRDGMRVDELEQTLDELERSGRRPKFIYTVPNFHNPAGVTMSLERRRELVRIAGERELIVLEDNPYGLLRYEGESLPPLHSLDDEFVIYASTFSKILSPGRAPGLGGGARADPGQDADRQAGLGPVLLVDLRSTSSAPTSTPARGTTTSARCWRSTAGGAT